MERAKAHLTRLRGLAPGLFGNFDVSLVARHSATLWKFRGYDAVPHSVSETWRQIRQEFGADGLSQFNRALLCELIATADDRLANEDLPECILQEYADAFSRVLDKLEIASNTYDVTNEETFLKDLGVCSQTMIPAGYIVMDIANGMVRELLYSGGLRQFFRFFHLYVLRYRRKGPFLFTHYHGDHRELFNPEGRVKTFWTIAQLMKRRTEFKAVVGTSWYLDPAVSTISPHLAYIRTLPGQNGAVFFRNRPKVHYGALASRTRRRLYEEGKYTPCPYTMVWPREMIIAWADRTTLSIPAR